MRIIALGDRDPTHLTHREIDATLALLSGQVDCGWVATDSAEARELQAVDAVWLLPGTPYRDDGAARAAIHHCLETGTPFLGTCGGFQYACVELARVRAGVSDATSAELDPGGSALVVAPLACSLYGERRTVTPVAGTRLAAICGVEPFEGHHHCGYGLADAYEAVLAGPAWSSRLTPPTRGWRASSCPTIRSSWPPRSSPRWAAAGAAPCIR